VDGATIVAGELFDLGAAAEAVSSKAVLGGAWRAAGSSARSAQALLTSM
jgi:hypothetical protein